MAKKPSLEPRVVDLEERENDLETRMFYVEEMLRRISPRFAEELGPELADMAAKYHG